MKTDSLFYRLFQAIPSLALELAGITISERAAYEFRSEEIKQTAFRLDGVLIPAAEVWEAPVMFVEVQYQPNEGFYGRYFRGDSAVSVSVSAAPSVAGAGDLSQPWGGAAERTALRFSAEPAVVSLIIIPILSMN